MGELVHGIAIALLSAVDLVLSAGGVRRRRRRRGKATGDKR